MNTKAMEIQTLIIITLAVVFLLVMILFFSGLIGESNIFSGPNNICNQTGGFFRSC